MKVRRVLQRDAVEREVLRCCNHEDSRAVLVGVLHLRLLCQIPPRNFLSDQRSAAAFKMIAANQRLASTAAVVDHAATPARYVVIAGIAGSEQCCIGVDKQTDTAFQLKWPGEENVVWPAARQFNGMPGGAVIQRILDSIRVGFGFVEVRREAGIECGADFRGLWLSDG